ncbi:molybdopterin-dependent oxidoreductase [Desulfoglaeba alkanexedens]|uniref:2Fe-2S iron-sulfur cluster binding domain-containing protein n=1 Tax=Desulfoglaeba alkanexedens ALDC TaxID=980445 RepID=A0A4P8L088_9BACT|nr:molybdopterin-dependent oxidoreductase [Desulfoglaeba alkanexedens]QCQ20923.1 2Fe-2S iron-sulfur cluster binding domain-containing protein [Desulfoglaeba alkanexedens ALDC]
MIYLKIDGKEIHAEPGMTILQAADANGIYIPRLCYHKALSPIGSCRLCVVEVKPGPPRPVPSCTTPVADNMEVTTRSERLDRYRREVLQLLLINHPLDCPICDKGGECELQNMVRELKISEQPYQAVKLVPKYDNLSPLIERYPDRCVNCERCVRVCRDWVGAAALYFDNRGYRTTVTAGGPVMDCEFCGSCIAVCPVGAIVDKTFKYSARAWELEKEPAVCPYCGGGCHLFLNTKHGKLKRVTSSFDEPVNGGIICSRGRFSLNILEHPERLTRPMLRKDGSLQPVSWEEAFDFVAGRLREIREKHGPEAIGGVGSPRATNESNYVFQKFMRLVVESPNVDATPSLDHQKILRAFVEVMGRPRVQRTEAGGPEPGRIREVSGFQLAVGSYEDLRRADTVVVLGADVKKEMPPYAWHINQAQKHRTLKNLVIVSSRGTRMRSAAQWNGYCRPGSYGLVVVGLLKVLFEEGGLSTHEYGEFLGGRNLEAGLARLSWAEVEAHTGMSRDELSVVAHALKEAERPSLIIGCDLAGLREGYETGCYVADLLLFLGRKLKVHLVSEKANHQGCSDMGVSPYWLPGYRPFDKADAVAEVWGKRPPAGPGLTLMEMIGAAAGESGRSLRALLVMGTNLLATLPNRRRTQKALENLDLLVCQEVFLNETAAMADCVFPALTSVETGGTVTNTEFRVQRQLGRAFVEGPRADWEILQEIGARLGTPMAYGGPEEILEEIQRLFPHYEQYPLKEMPREGFLWNQLHRAKYGSTTWKRKLDPTLEMAAPDLPPHVRPSEDRPFLLFLGKSLFQSGTLTRYGLGATELEAEGRFLFHPEDARELGLQEGDRVVVHAAAESLEGPVGIDKRMARGSVGASLHFADLPVQLLTEDGNLCPVRIEVKRAEG